MKTFFCLLVLLAGAAVAYADCASNEFSAFGIGVTEEAALAAARASLAPQIYSSIKVSNKSIQTQSVSTDGKEDLSSKFQSKTEEESTLLNAHDARIVRKERAANNKIRITVCMSRADAAKGFVQQLKPVADSLEFSANSLIETKHPKLKTEAWQKTQTLYSEFARLKPIVEGLDKEKAAPFETVNALYTKARDGYLAYCQTAKMYWNPEQNTTYSETAFSKLSKNIKLLKSSCEGYGISLQYKNNAVKCEYAGIYRCSYRPSLVIASCQGEEYRLLESPQNIEGLQKKEEAALETVNEKLGYETFWSVWEQEIKQWRSQCE